MTVTAKKLAANRANALKSTGPRTARGRRRVSMNGLRHGFFAQHLVLKGENMRDFIRLRMQLLHDLRPRGAIELLLVERIVSASWRLRRLQTIESVTHHTAAARRLPRARDDDEQSDQLDERQNKRDMRRFVARALHMPAISSIAYGLAEGDDLMERLSRYE